MFRVQNIFFILLSFILGVSTFYGFSVYSKIREESKKLNSLTFANTQTWNLAFLQFAKNATPSVSVTLPVPPTNTSRETEEELAILHRYQEARTQENVAEIQREVFLEDAYFGEETFGSLTLPERRPATAALMQYVADFEFSLIMAEKLRFNRVRPSRLDPTLIPSIIVPSHPAYPSGHSTQAHLRAHILSVLNAENSEVYTAAADRIARNREIAGVHYPSDSRVGALFAEQLFSFLTKDEDFLTLMTEAKAEW